MLSSLLLTLLVLPAPIRSTNGGKEPKQFNESDLLIVDGSLHGTNYSGQIVICVDPGPLMTEGAHLKVTAPKENEYYNDNKSIDYDFQEFMFPNTMLRAFSMNKWRATSNHSSTALSAENRFQIKCICDASKLLAQCSKDKKFDWSFVTDEMKTLCFGSIVREFGFNGYYYGTNCFFGEDNNLRFCEQITESEPEFLNGFEKKYLKLKHRSLVNANVQKGDLVKVKRKLKQQNNECLQARAAHFDGSFGRIITSRKNNRNQTEYPIVSLFDKDMKLALRPKYLFKITKIYVHRIANDLPFRRFRDLLMSLLDNQSNQILYLDRSESELLSSSSFDHFIKVSITQKV